MFLRFWFWVNLEDFFQVEPPNERVASWHLGLGFVRSWVRTQLKHSRLLYRLLINYLTANFMVFGYVAKEKGILFHKAAQFERVTISPIINFFFKTWLVCHQTLLAFFLPRLGYFVSVYWPNLSFHSWLLIMAIS